MLLSLPEWLLHNWTATTTGLGLPEPERRSGTQATIGILPFSSLESPPNKSSGEGG